jgi:hypothetical protein
MHVCIGLENIEEYNLKTFGVKTKLFGKKEREM